MSNDVQSHEERAESVAEDDRRRGVRHAARALGSVTARIIGGSQVDLVNFSSRGVLFECDSRLLIGARASVRITTTDANIIVTGRVVRSRVKGLVDGALRYDAALVLDTELTLAPAIIAGMVPAASDDDLVAFESDLDAMVDPSPVEAYVAESEASLLDVAHDDLPLQLGADVGAAAAAEAGSPAVAPASEGGGAEDVGLEAEPIAFEPDGEIAFEPAVEFAFESGEPGFELLDAAFKVDPLPVPVDALPADAEPAAPSMFDATYTPPVYETDATESQFDVTPPNRVAAAPASSFFDPQPSDTFGVAPAEAAVENDVEAPAADPDAPAADPDAEDYVLLQFAATVPHDLADLRRIAADNQW